MKFEKQCWTVFLSLILVGNSLPPLLSGNLAYSCVPSLPNPPALTPTVVTPSVAMEMGKLGREHDRSQGAVREH